MIVTIPWVSCARQCAKWLILSVGEFLLEIVTCSRLLLFDMHVPAHYWFFTFIFISSLLSSFEGISCFVLHENVNWVSGASTNVKFQPIGMHVNMLIRSQRLRFRSGLNSKPLATSHFCLCPMLGLQRAANSPLSPDQKSRFFIENFKLCNFSRRDMTPRELQTSNLWREFRVC